MVKTDIKSGGRQFTGTVVSAKTKDTAIVEVAKLKKHRLYKKTLRRSRRFAVNLSGLEVKLGDQVVIKEIKPVSKTKHFQVVGKAAS